MAASASLKYKAETAIGAGAKVATGTVDKVGGLRAAGKMS